MEKNQKRPRIKKVSLKRHDQLIVYKKKKEEIWLRLVAEKKNRCFFTNQIIPFIEGKVPDFHHSLGRDGDMLTDEKFMFPCYPAPHMEYHSLQYDYENLKRYSWYFDWLKRIETSIPILYYKELRKMDKANGKTNQRPTDSIQ